MDSATGEWDAARIRRLREREGLTQQDLAAELGVSKSSVEFWEMDERAPNDVNKRRLKELETTGSDAWLRADSIIEAIEALRARAADSGMAADEWYAEQLEAILDRHAPEQGDREHELEGAPHG